MNNAPTWENQITRAREVLRDDGPHALLNPHAATGKICGCMQCFCCAALKVYWEYQKTQVKA